jgi:ABC-type phosphate transport system substrate-binding protein
MHPLQPTCSIVSWSSIRFFVEIGMNLIKSLSLVLAFSASTAFADVAIIVNPANSSAVSLDDVSKLYLGKSKTFADGKAATPFNLPDNSPSHAVFSEKALNKNSSQLKAFWSKLVFTGKGTPPAELASDADVKAKVASDVSAIGYIDAAAVDGTVKVVTVLK